MNLHSLCKIDKSFKCVILKKNEFYGNGGYMFRYLWIALVVLMVVPGCRSRSQNESPETLTLTLDVEEASAEAVPAPVKSRKATPAPRLQVNNTAAEETRRVEGSQRKPTPERRVFSSMPYSSGQMDSELGDIEQNYVNSIRQRHNQQVKENESRVFGGFTPASLFGK